MNKVDITLYGIVDPEHVGNRDLVTCALESIKGGVTLIQYRDKQNDAAVMIDNCETLKRALAPLDVPFVVNDRVDVALASNADGVHLGQSDMPVSIARKLLGDEAIIGLSIKTKEDARTSRIEKIDYAFIGGVFTTTSKQNPTALGLEGWQERARILRERRADLPLGAIAGITSQNAASLIPLNCNGIAAIASIYKSKNVSAAAQALKNAFMGA